MVYWRKYKASWTQVLSVLGQNLKHTTLSELQLCSSRANELPGVFVVLGQVKPPPSVMRAPRIGRPLLPKQSPRQLFTPGLLLACLTAVNLMLREMPAFSIKFEEFSLPTSAEHCQLGKSENLRNAEQERTSGSSTRHQRTTFPPPKDRQNWQRDRLLLFVRSSYVPGITFNLSACVCKRPAGLKLHTGSPNLSCS